MLVATGPADKIATITPAAHWGAFGFTRLTAQGAPQQAPLAVTYTQRSRSYAEHAVQRGTIPIRGQQSRRREIVLASKAIYRWPGAPTINTHQSAITENLTPSVRALTAEEYFRTYPGHHQICQRVRNAAYVQWCIRPRIPTAYVYFAGARCAAWPWKEASKSIPR